MPVQRALVSLSAALVAAAAVVWLASGTWLGITDFRSSVLPTRVIWPTAGVVWVLYAAASLLEGEPGGLAGAAVGAALCGAILAAVHLAHPPAMGFGDVRLSVLNGVLCGWWGWEAALVGLTAGFMLAVPEATVVLVRSGLRASRPLGPYLLAGTAATVVWVAATRGLVPGR